MNNKSAMQWYKLRPIDGWFFRDGRPSNAGEDQSDLRSIFPPHPQTVVGGLRAALARTMGWIGGPWSPEITRQLGDGFDDVTPLKFSPPFLARQADHTSDVQLLFPVPRHVLGVVGSADGRVTFTPQEWLRPANERRATDMGEILLPIFPATESGAPRLASAEDFFITAEGLQKVLKGQKPESGCFIHQDELFAFEHRIGINRDLNERSMYSPGFVRLAANVSMVVGVQGLDQAIDVPHLFPLGGESRMANCERLNNPPVVPLSTGGDVLLLLSPASFENTTNWFGAAAGDAAGNLSDLLDGNVETCVIDRPTKIGGFDSRQVSNHGSLPLNPFVAAGTIWWLDQSSRVPASNAISLGARTSFGYGFALLAKRPE